MESVQVFKHLNKLISKSSLYETNEFQILELLLVAMVSDLLNHFVDFICALSILSTMKFVST